MDNHDILPNQLKLTASSCLLISAKYVDTDQNIPQTSQLQSLTDNQNSLLEYSQMEKMLLNFMGNRYYNRIEQRPVLRFIPPTVHIVQTTQSSGNITQSWEEIQKVNKFRLKALGK